MSADVNGWEAHLLDDWQRDQRVLLVRRRAYGSGGDVIAQPADPGVEAPIFLRLPHGSVPAIAAALVEHAPAQSETVGRLDEVRSALELERHRVDRLLALLTGADAALAEDPT